MRGARGAAGAADSRVMADEASAGTYREKDKVRAAQDLPGVPQGTAGTVVSVNGLSWIRYRVRFENGRELNLLDGKRLTGAARR